jgi:hypothetical protein
MPFTAQEVENVANAAIEYHYKTPEVRSQSLQEKPLLKAMMAAEESFPGGKDEITARVKGEYTTTIQGFEHDDTVSYSNPANIKTARVPWKLIHSGIEVTMHELLKDGISISDTATGEGEVQHSKREKTVLANLMKDKVEDMMEGTDRGMNLMFWRDGTQDSKLVPGLRSFILDDPTSATVVCGIDQSANTWWRNRASLLIDASTPANSNMINKLQTEWRQLRRYGGRPNRVLCGSDWLEAQEKELRAMGSLTDSGWRVQKATDASIADVYFKGVKFEYDPTLDDEGLAKYCYVLDTRRIKPMAIEGESMKKHNPARPETKYVFYRALTWVGGLMCNQRNCHGVYSIA